MDRHTAHEIAFTTKIHEKWCPWKLTSHGNYKKNINNKNKINTWFQIIIHDFDFALSVWERGVFNCFLSLKNIKSLCETST